MNMPALASAPQMVGRRAEFDALREAFDDARTGHPRTAIVRGEAGIGKTRLVTEFLADIAQRHGDMPVVIAQGQCVDLGPIGAPFGPVRRVLRDLHAEVGTEALQAAAGSPAAVAALAALLPGIATEPSGVDDRAGEFAEAVEVLLESLSTTHHVVVVIEDLQWADAATLALLKTLASTLRGRHLTIVATYRSDDIDRFHPLRPVLAELERTRGIIRIDLAPLSIEEVAEQVGQLVADGTVDGPRLVALAERSGGIPFLVEELVDLGDAGLPDTLRDLVLARYARLSDGAQQALRAMAAGGVHVDHEALAAVAGVEERELDIVLREAIEARVVLAEGAGYTFRHALTHEAVHAEMLPSEKVRLHRAYAEHLARRPDPSLDDLSALAEHWLAARDLGAAFDATVAALERSRAGYSPATSAKLAERLTELWDQVPEAQRRADATLAELHLTAALAWHDLSEAERALRAANEGLAACPADDKVTRAALLRQRFVQQFNYTHDSRRADLEEAIALLEGAREHRARVLLSRTLSNLAMGEDGEQAAAHAHEAIRIAEDAGDAPALAVALTIEMWRLSDDEDDEPAALVPIERAAGLRLDPSVRAYVAGPHVDLLMRVGRFDEAILIGEQQYADAVRSGIERGAGSAIAYLVAQALFAAGRPDDARRYAQRAQRFAAGTMRASGVRLMAAHHAWNDEPDEREELLAGERATVDTALRTKPGKQQWWVVDRAGWMAVTGAPTADGVTRADTLEALFAIIDGDAARVIRRYSTIAAAMLARLDDDAAVRERLTATADAWPDRGINPLMAAFVRAGLTAGEPPDVQIAAWRPVVDHVGLGELPVWHRHVARLWLAAALIEAGERDEAATLLDAIQQNAPGHGVALVARRAAELASQARLVSAPTPAPGAAPAGGVLDALTARELQVLELIAEGLTNPQIGKRLFISPKTASVHVSAILAKIGAANRAEAAALYAAR